MGLLDSFEKGLERAVNGAFAKTFRSGIQPVEIASALRREADTSAAVVSRDRILIPHHYCVYLSPADAERMQALGSTLGAELRSLLTQHAQTQGYSLAGPLSIDLLTDDRTTTGTVRVEADSPEGAVTWQATVEVNGRSFTLNQARTVVGRSHDADISIDDPGSSRKHFEILWDGERAMMRDLGSTNGTSVSGLKVREAALPPDSVITVGRTELVFRVVPTTPLRSTPMHYPDQTVAFDKFGAHSE